MHPRRYAFSRTDGQDRRFDTVSQPSSRLSDMSVYPRQPRRNYLVLEITRNTKEGCCTIL